MLVKVTRKHIKNGKRKSICRCPIALALKSKGYSQVEVSHGSISVVTPGTCLSWIDLLTVTPMSRSVKKFVRNFDDGKPVKSFSFRIRG